MKRLALAAALLAIVVPAFAQGEKTEASENPMARWRPPKITNEQKDRQEIQALLKQFEAAGKNADLDAAVVLLDFPVLMVTDNSRGEVKADSWTKEKWVEQMRPFYTKHPMGPMTNKPTITVLSDSLAVVTNQWSMAMGKQKVSARSALELVRVDGKWRIKSMTEGGWGDVMGCTPAASAGGAPSTGTGSATGTDSTMGTGSTTGSGSSTESGPATGTGSAGTMPPSPPSETSPAQPSGTPPSPPSGTQPENK